jgi:hypothetical protein
MRVIVTLTTIPPRGLSILETIKSIQQNTVKSDAIYVNLPVHVPRFPNQKYHEDLVPLLKDLGVIVNRCEDMGTLTKSIPTLKYETDKDTLFIVVDDDGIYSERFIEGLVKGYKEFNSVVGYSGIAYPDYVKNNFGRVGYLLFQKHGDYAHILETSFGIAIKREWLSHIVKPFPHNGIYDDYILALLFDRINVKKRVINYNWIGRKGDEWSSIVNFINQDENAISFGKSSIEKFYDKRIETCEYVNGPKMCIISLLIGEKYTQIFKNCVDTHKEYAKRWGYGYLLIDTPHIKNVNINFQKYWGALKCFDEGYEWVLYVDADAIVNNMNIPLTYYTNECSSEKDIIMMREIPLDKYCGLSGFLNGGVYIIRNTEWSRNFLSEMINMGVNLYNELNIDDQELLRRILIQNQHLLQKFWTHEWDRKHSINGFLSFMAKTGHKDDFIIHFISCVPNSPELIPKYMKLLNDTDDTDKSLEFKNDEYKKYHEKVMDMTSIPQNWPNYKFI